jgi:hypothetical protein
MKSTAELSKDYVRTSLNEFEDDPIMSLTLIDEIRTAQPDGPLARAYQAFDDGLFTDIPSLCTQELDSSLASPYRLQALLLRGSFYLLMGNYPEAIDDFNTVVNDPDTSEKVIDENKSCLVIFICHRLDENQCSIKTSEYKDSSA